MAFNRIRPRRATLAEWTAANPVLLSAEMAIVVPNTGIGTGKVKIKFGDGTTSFNSLPYAYNEEEIDSSLIEYDNTESGLLADNLKSAIDELADRPINDNAVDVDFNNSISGLVAENVQDAIDEVKSEIGNLNELETESNADLVEAINEVDLLGKSSNFILNNQERYIKSDKIFGQEYLSAFHKKQLFNSTSRICFSGDSTTSGYGLAAPEIYAVDVAFSTLCIRHSLPGITCVNAGHSGATTNQWYSTYIDQDFVTPPDLYIVRWGINDGNVSISSDLNTRASIFETHLRNGLAKIRALTNGALNKCSIVLMTPNSTYAPSTGRDASWHEIINPIIRKAARDYQCCFIDLYNIYKDSEHGSDWMDTISGEHIHPLDLANLWITDLTYRTVFPDAYVRQFNDSALLTNTYTYAGLSIIFRKIDKIVSVTIVGTTTAAIPYGTYYTLGAYNSKYNPVQPLYGDTTNDTNVLPFYFRFNAGSLQISASKSEIAIGASIKSSFCWIIN